MNKIYTAGLLATFLSGCANIENYDYDDASVYPYDVSDHAGLGRYEDRDYSGDYYSGSVMQREMRWSKIRPHE